MTLMWLDHVSRPLNIISRLDADLTNSSLFPLIIISGTSNALLVLESNKHLDLEAFIQSPLALPQLSLPELLRLVGATFDFKMASLRRMRTKNLILLKSLQKQSV